MSDDETTEDKKSYLFAGATRSAIITLGKFASNLFRNPFHLFKPKRIKPAYFLLVTNKITGTKVNPSFFNYVKSHGLKATLNTILPPLFINAFYGTLAFSIYDNLILTQQPNIDQVPGHVHHHSNLDQVPGHAHFLSGLLTGILMAPLCTPIDSVKMFAGDSKYLSVLENKGVMECTRKIIMEQRTTIFKGFRLTLLGDSLSYAFFFGTWGTLINFFLKHELGFRGEKALHIVISGALAGIAFNTITYPIDFFKGVMISKNWNYYQTCNYFSDKRLSLYTGFGRILRGTIPGTGLAFLVYSKCSEKFGEEL